MESSQIIADSQATPDKKRFKLTKKFNYECHIEILPDEILEEIFRILCLGPNGPTAVAKASAVCKRWNRAGRFTFATTLYILSNYSNTSKYESVFLSASIAEVLQPLSAENQVIFFWELDVAIQYKKQVIEHVFPLLAKLNCRQNAKKNGLACQYCIHSMDDCSLEERVTYRSIARTLICDIEGQTYQNKVDFWNVVLNEHVYEYELETIFLILNEAFQCCTIGMLLPLVSVIRKWDTEDISAFMSKFVSYASEQERKANMPCWGRLIIELDENQAAAVLNALLEGMNETLIAQKLFDFFFVRYLKPKSDVTIPETTIRVISKYFQSVSKNCDRIEIVTKLGGLVEKQLSKLHDIQSRYKTLQVFTSALWRSIFFQ